MSEQVGFVPLMFVGDAVCIEVTQEPSNDFKVSVQTGLGLWEDTFASFVDAKKAGFARAALLLASDLRELLLNDLITVADSVECVWQRCDADRLEQQIVCELERIRKSLPEAEYQQRSPMIEGALDIIQQFFTHLRSLPSNEVKAATANAEQTHG